MCVLLILHQDPLSKSHVRDGGEQYLTSHLAIAKVDPLQRISEPQETGIIVSRQPELRKHENAFSTSKFLPPLRTPFFLP